MYNESDGFYHLNAKGCPAVCLRLAADGKAEGVYPLTKDLRYIVENYGINSGWWDAGSPGYLF